MLKTKEEKLFEAVALGNLKAIETLLQDGADIHYIDNFGRTVLLVPFVWTNIDVVTYLLEHGADVNATTKLKKSPLMLATEAKIAEAYYLDPESSKKETGCSEVIKVLLAYGANANAQDIHGHTALMKSSTSYSLETVKALLESGADIHIKDKDGVTALLAASMENFSKSVELLLQYGADVNAQDNNGTTALMKLSKTDFFETMDILLEYGADVNIQDNNGATALMGFSTSCFPRTVKALLKHGADTNIQDIHGNTALMEAAAGGCTTSLKLLLKYGADINAQDKNGVTALMKAATEDIIYNFESSAVRFLLKHGADVNIQDKHGNTALMKASGKARWKTIKLLLKYGADVKAQDINGVTALMNISTKILSKEARNMLGYSHYEFEQSPYDTTAIIKSIKKNAKEYLKTAKVLLRHEVKEDIKSKMILTDDVKQTDIAEKLPKHSTIKNHLNTKVFGLGDAGINIVNYFIQNQMNDCSTSNKINYITVDKEKEDLMDSIADQKLYYERASYLDDSEYIYSRCTPYKEKNKFRFIETNQLEQKFISLLNNTDIAFICVGLGGETGTSLASLVAKKAKAESRLTVGILLLPFDYSKGAIAKAQKKLEELTPYVDIPLIISNDEMGNLVIAKNIPAMQVFDSINETIFSAFNHTLEIATRNKCANLNLSEWKAKVEKEVKESLKSESKWR